MKKDDKIIIKGAKEHNLKEIDVSLPRNKFVVITGLSGSGKSSLAFDTIFAEGQRLYVESLSAYARQFLGQKEKPKVDYISGLSPAISIQQKSASQNPRSTVGTITEINDYLRVLYARIGKPICYNCGRPVENQTTDQIINAVFDELKDKRIYILAPLAENRKGTFKDLFETLLSNGYVRVRVDGDYKELEKGMQLEKKNKHDIDLVVDRLKVKEENRSRIADSLETGLEEGDGLIKILDYDSNEEKIFSTKLGCPHCSISYPEPSPQLFSFNSPIGMCHECNGLGETLEVAEELIVSNENLSINEGAVLYWGELSKKTGWTANYIRSLAEKLDIPLDVPFKDLTKKQKNVIFNGTTTKVKLEWKSDNSQGSFWKQYEGVLNEIKRRYKQTTSDGARNYYEKFMYPQKCKSCNGYRLNNYALSYLVSAKKITDLGSMPIDELYDYFDNLELTDNELIIAEELLKEIKNRLKFMLNVGLHYLDLNRNANTLSGGEAQRIRLASQIGNGLMGVIYVLDEPSIGLHQRDNKRLLDSLINLRDRGNTVIVVEHDEDTIKEADYIVDLGPGAGHYGGEVVVKGTYKQLLRSKKSLTANYLNNIFRIGNKTEYRQGNEKKLKIIGAAQNNLKNIDVEFPLGKFVGITGVSGSGKSSLINEILYKGLARILNRNSVHPGKHKRIEGTEHLKRIINIDQNPIGRTPRSNPATYTGVFNHIRDIFAKTKDAKIRGYKPGRFSFNVAGGRCEACNGAGIKKIEMHFLPDVYINCEVCNGKRYNDETLKIRYKGKNISDVLDMEVVEAYDFFKNIPKLREILDVLNKVGLGYIKLGQSATTLSGGEAQRIKLSKELHKKGNGDTLYILDEPTTGLHFHDIKKLLEVLDALVDSGNTVVVIEHNLDVIKNVDYIIDLGPEGGNNGGTVIAEGTPLEIIKNENSYTGQFLKEKIGGDNEENINNKKNSKRRSKASKGQI